MQIQLDQMDFVCIVNNIFSNIQFPEKSTMKNSETILHSMLDIVGSKWKYTCLVQKSLMFTEA